MTSLRIPVWGPLAKVRIMLPAIRMRLPRVQLAWRRCEEGICIGYVFGCGAGSTEPRILGGDALTLMEDLELCDPR